MNEFPGLTFAENENCLVALIRPAPDHPVLDADVVRALLENAGFGTWSLADEALGALIESYNAGATVDLPIGERRDSGFTVEVSSDAMSAWINVVPAHGGKSLDSDEINLALGEAGVSSGIDPAAVSTACAARVEERIQVATGTPAVNGEEARFELLIADARDRAPRVSENGLIDFRELGAIPTVAAEQPLMRRIPPTTGTAGRTVRGDIIEPVPGRNATFAENMIGAYVSPDDVNLLLSAFSGQPVGYVNGVNIEQILHVRNVNMASGNISFDGTVNIAGEVLPGMKVHATGDIVVGGAVDGAELDAGGDIHIDGGVIAKAHVRAGGSVSVRFVENAQVTAGTTIVINDTALQSDLQANNQILVGVKSKQRGRLAGGSARAMLLIQTPILGSSTGGVTKLLLGVNPVLEAQYQELLHTIEKQRASEQDLEKLIKHLTKQGDKAGMLERVKASWQQALQGWAALLPERDELERQLALIAQARVEVGASVSGAVDIMFGKKLARVRGSYETGSFLIEGDRVIFADMVGNVKVAS